MEVGLDIVLRLVAKNGDEDPAVMIGNVGIVLGFSAHFPTIRKIRYALHLISDATDRKPHESSGEYDAECGQTRREVM